MKTNVALKILLILSIILQSFAVSVSADAHQLDAEHFQSTHNHETDHTSKLDDDKKHDMYDCHHCGHCSGNHTNWFLVKAFTLNLPKNHFYNFNKLTLFPHSYSTRLNRPPIA
ncbi:DUF2946 family protein [Shewanella intestini]|uniref:DUF2946 family protein n=1 Tax=Shewanella TaxID=22 RepID=UPI003621B85B